MVSLLGLKMTRPLRLVQLATCFWVLTTALWLLLVIEYVKQDSDLVKKIEKRDLPRGKTTFRACGSDQPGQMAADLREISSFTGKDIQKNASKVQKVKHVAFLKVHKTASTTVQNIFLRFGWFRNLSFVLPPENSSYGFPNIISLTESLKVNNILPPNHEGHYDILCNHVLYENEAFRKFLPNDTAYIGILRDPFEQFKSVIKYMKPDYIYNNSKVVVKLSDFLRNPKRYEPDGTPNYSWTNNRMAVEFGTPYKLFDHYNKSTVQTYLEKLDQEFKLILIAELLDESILLLRRYLKWETKDVLYLNQNVLHLADEALTPFDRWFHKRYAKLDYDLYRYFYKRLRLQIREQGVDFDDELLAFREIITQVREYCFLPENDGPLIFGGTKWGGPFDVSRSDCADMMRQEIDFVDLIRTRQYGAEKGSVT